MMIDRKTLKILLAALELEQHELATAMGYDATYVANVLGGHTRVSDSFRAGFGEFVAEAILGEKLPKATLPAAPLIEFIEKRAADAGCKSDFYDQLGLASNGWHKRKRVTVAIVDRLCCKLGVHPTAVYGPDYEVSP